MAQHFYRLCPPLFEVPINEVTTEQVLAVLQPIWLSKAETASRLRGRIERILDAAKAKGLRSGENPAGVCYPDRSAIWQSARDDLGRGRSGRPDESRVGA